jgi:hypothetical protein
MCVGKYGTRIIELLFYKHTSLKDHLSTNKCCIVFINYGYLKVRMMSNEAENIFPYVTEVENISRDIYELVPRKAIPVPAGAKDKKAKEVIGKMMLRMEDGK